MVMCDVTHNTWFSLPLYTFCIISVFSLRHVNPVILRGGV